jgi:hypothetical protein
VQLPQLVAHRPVRRDHRAQHDHAVAGQEIGDEPDAAHVLVAILTGEAEALREVGPDDVAVEDLDVPAVVEQPLLDGARDRRLPGRRESRQPHGLARDHVAAHSPSPTSAT